MIYESRFERLWEQFREEYAETKEPRRATTMNRGIMSYPVPSPGSVRDEMEQIYSEMSPADIPWNTEDPPRELVDLVEGGQVRPCKTIDVGCGVVG